MFLSILCSELRLHRHQLYDNNDSTFTLLVTDEWLECIKETRDPVLSPLQCLPSAIECNLLLQPSNTENNNLVKHVLLTYIARKGRAQRVVHTKEQYLDEKGSMAQLMTYIQYDSTRPYYKCTVPLPNTFSEEVFESLVESIYSPSHPNYNVLLGTYITQTHFYMILQRLPYSINTVICHTPLLLSGMTRPLFVLYQMLHCLRWLHSEGVPHGNIRSTNTLVSDNLWVKMSGAKYGLDNNPKPTSSSRPPPLQYPYKVPPSTDNSSSLVLYTSGAWLKGYISNLDYLLHLNIAAGHKVGDPNLHPIVPWVFDFSTMYGGWRDLSKSKFRLNKGDYHLDSTYKSHSSAKAPTPLRKRSRRSFHEEEVEISVTPHHLIDTLSEITYFSYFARRTSKKLLCKNVRGRWEPHEYPTSMSHYYNWTPDECIPEFYTNPEIFVSIHDDLSDIVLPQWSSSPEDFIKKHRNALESDYISSKLHQWIDLIFGDKLFGSPSVSSKNVYKELVDNHRSVTNKGVRQLFKWPHPKRLFTTPSVPRLPLSRQESCEQVEVCVEPDYDTPSQTPPEMEVMTRTGTVPGTPIETDQTRREQKRIHSMDPDTLKQALLFRNRKKLSQELTFLFPGMVQDCALVSSAIHIPKDKLYNRDNLFSKTKYITQFYRELGGTIWVDKGSTKRVEKEDSVPDNSLKALKRRDIQGVAGVFIEMLSTSHLPSLNKELEWDSYLEAVRQLWERGRDDIFDCYNDLIEYMLDSKDVLCTAEYLLHQHTSVLSVPPYLPQLYDMLHIFHLAETDDAKISHCSQFFNSHPSFLGTLNNAGMGILLANIKTLFWAPLASRAFVKLFDVLASHCDTHAMLKELGEPLQHLFSKHTKTQQQVSEKILLVNINFVMSIKKHFGSQYFLRYFINCIIEDVADTECTTTLYLDSDTALKHIRPSGLALEAYNTLKELLPSLGPILTAKYVTSKLLQVLVGCHVFSEEVGLRYGGQELVMQFLIDIAIIYGNAFIDTQYIPRVFNMVKSSMFRVTAKNEAKLLAALAVVHESVKYLDGVTIQNMWEDLTKFVFEPIMRLLTSSRTTFPQSGSGRVELCDALSGLLVLMVKLVLSYTDDKELVLPLVRQYFLMFDCVSYLYNEAIAKDEVITSPCRSLENSQEEHYFLNLEHQFPSYPKRYDAIAPPVGESPLLGHTPTLIDTLNMERENLLCEDGLTNNMNSAESTNSETASEDVEMDLAEVTISLMPVEPPSTSFNNNEVHSMVETDTDPDHEGINIGFNLRNRRPSSSSSPCRTSRSKSLTSDEDNEIPQVPDSLKKLDTDSLDDSNTTSGEFTSQEQIEKSLTPDIAQNTYVQICRLIGQETLRRTVENIDLIEILAYMDIPDTSSETASSRINYSSSYLTDSSSAPYVTNPSSLFATRSFDESDALKENWRRVWEDSVASTDDNFSFRHIFLQHFRGHTDRVTSLHVFENESFMLSSSKDKSVILWDLRASNKGVGRKVRRFEEHGRPVLGLSYLEYANTAATMDTQQLLTMDLEYDRVTHRFDSKNGLVLASLPATSHLIVQGISDSTLRIFDTRVDGGLVLEWRAAASLRGVHFIRCLECDKAGMWVAAGFSSGALNVLDLRIGLVLQSFRPHTADITKIISCHDGDVYTSSMDHNVSHWKRVKNFTDGNDPDVVLYGPKEPVLCMCMLGDDIITCSSSRVNTYNPYRHSTSTKLRTDNFRGGVSTLATMPLNKLIVLGSDTGLISMFS